MTDPVNKSPDEIFEIALKLKAEKKYEDSIKLFYKASDLYLVELDIQQNVRAFDCAYQIALIEVELSTIKSVFEFGFSPNDTIIKELMFNFDKIEYLIKEKSNWEGKFKNKFKELRIKEKQLQVLRIFEQQLREKGLDEIATVISIRSAELEIVVSNLKTKALFLFGRHKIISILLMKTSEYLLKLMRLLGYGLNLGKIALVFIFSLIFFSITYYIIPIVIPGFDKLGVVYQGNPKTTANFLECIYFSMMILTGIGTEEYWPVGWLTKLFVSIEGILGYIILSLLVAHFVRRIK